MRSAGIGILHFLQPHRTTILLLISLFVTGPVQPQTFSGGQVVTLVDSYKVRVRATPEILDENILASLLKGTQLPLLGEEGGWYRVRLPDGKEGWVYSKFGKVEEPRDQLEVIFEVVRVRAGPSTSSDKIAKAIQGQRLHLLAERGGWYQVEIPNEIRGWIRADTVVSRPVVTDPVAETLEKPAPPVELSSQEGISQAESEPEPSLETASQQVVGKAEAESSDFPESKPDSPAAIAKAARIPETDRAFPSLTEIGSDWLGLVGLVAGITVLLAAILAFYRRKRLNRLSEVVKQGRQAKNAQLEHSLRNQIKRTENKLGLLDKQLQGRLTEFRSSSPEAESLGSKTSDDMLANLEELRKVIENQQERLNLYSEIVSLQNEQIATYQEENAAIRKLLEVKEQD